MALREAKEELVKLNTVLARNRKARRFTQKLREIAEVMHRQALPQVVAQSNLQDMDEDINQGLESFGSPFWVEASADLSFNVHFPGEPVRPASWLSCGQKGVLAISFRTAVCNLFDADAGFLSLDEPTADLDAVNRAGLADALTKYAAKIRGQRQVIVISHAAELRSAFDAVIDLEAYAQN